MGDTRRIERLTFDEAMALAQAGTRVRRPLWHRDNYMIFGNGEFWTIHRPYYPKPDHKRLFHYIPTVADRAAKDWKTYRGEPDDLEAWTSHPVDEVARKVAEKLDNG